MREWRKLGEGLGTENRWFSFLKVVWPWEILLTGQISSFILGYSWFFFLGPLSINVSALCIYNVSRSTKHPGWQLSSRSPRALSSVPLQRFKRSLYHSAVRSVPQAQSRMDLRLHLNPPHSKKNHKGIP